jgi:predicted nucleic acid-binding protein
VYEAAVVDASPLIILSRAGLMDLLESLDCPLFVPQEVSLEVEEKGSRDVTVMTIRQIPSLQPARVGEVPPSIAAWNLGSGESAVLTWAHKHPGTLAVLDDKMGRRCAESLEIPVLGTAGLVLVAKRKHRISEAKPLLRSLIAAGLYLSERTLAELLKRAGE